MGISTQENISEKQQPLLGTINAAKSGEGLFLNSHPYHTKLPPSIITQHIEHYTNAGDVVLDPFCGSGMTGVASLLTKRDVILNDLSVAAVHIAKGYTKRVNENEFNKAIDNVLEAVERDIASLYQTNCSDCGGNATIAYSIWSDVYNCPECTCEFVLWDFAVNEKDGKVSQKFPCKNCGKLLEKKNLGKLKINSIPVITVYDCNNGCKSKRKEHRTTEIEKENLKIISQRNFPQSSPIIEMMHTKPGEKWGEQWRSGYHADVTHVHNFFTKRNFLALSIFYDKILDVKNEAVKEKLLFAFTASLVAVSRMVKYIPSRGGRSNIPGTLYVPSLNLEQNVFSVIKRRIDKIKKLVAWQSEINVKTQVNLGTAANLEWLKENSIDYIFTDPPFGANIQYAELNFITEAWLGKYTDKDKEIVINKTRDLDIERYNNLLKESLKQMYRVLKPDHYTSLVFHNTDSKVWDGLKEAIQESGFKVAGASMLDKGKGGWNQVTSSSGTARFDIIIHLEKNLNNNIPRFENIIDENTTLSFIQDFLNEIPNEKVRERTLPFIHSKVIQFIFSQYSLSSPPNMKELEKLLRNHFEIKDGYYFINA
ncbi:hypothetical protein COL65_20300 [Priestia aryabhattai]|uniref:DNA methyltransferase n=1 Tax=Priestia aryabhattai TaxID=412384 RepID=UPI000BF3C1E1|nr:DNA methyltransferase [Priestia aryabhattai]PGA16235.1 hypothetical protein COL65_20300 [Priestia aryabhattai]